MENLAIRMVYESSVLGDETKKHFYRNLLYSDEKDKKARFGANGGRKTHQWFLKAVFGTAAAEKPMINPHGAIRYPPDSSDPFQGFSKDGHVVDDTILTALPDDPYLAGLKKKFQGDVILGNVVLAARRQWFRGFAGDWTKLPDIPTSFLLTDLLEQISSDLDTETATNIATNFLRYQQRYISKRLQESLPLQHKDDLAELLCFTIDQLPLDERDDLKKVAAEVDLANSVDLQAFVATERQQLATWMAVELMSCDRVEQLEDGKVDVGFALGFGEKKCVLADYLLPAIMAMAHKAGMSVTLIPEPGPTYRPIQFNVDMTKRLVLSLPKFAKKFGADKAVAARICKVFYEELKQHKEDSEAYDLRAVSVLINVGV